MTFEVLNDNVMLVELTNEEMQKYNITYETLDCDSQGTKSAVENILATVKAGDKFNTSDKITVEVLPINDGGCFFIFTFSPKRKVRYKMKNTNESCVFCAETMDNLLDFLSVMKKRHKRNYKYEIYKVNNSFYMPIPENSKGIKAIMREYGNISDIKPEEIDEYGTFLGSVII